jgi:hypothetical protein
MINLLLYPDVFLIMLVSFILLLLATVTDKEISLKRLIMSLLVAILITIAFLFFRSQKFCGIEICFYHGWPHFLYISYGIPTFDILKSVRFPVYFLINVFFFFSLVSFIGVTIKRLRLRNY